jgi:hypothetical protein
MQIHKNFTTSRLQPPPLKYRKWDGSFLETRTIFENEYFIIRTFILRNEYKKYIKYSSTIKKNKNKIKMLVIKGVIKITSQKWK